MRRLKLEPVILANMVAEGQTIIEMLEKHRGNVKYACVLLTPDDEGHKRDCPKDKKFRARQNVVLELGMFLSTLGRKRVAILHKGEVELPSDIHGLVYIPFLKHVSEVKQRLLPNSKKLVSISTSKTCWPTERMKTVVIHSDGGCHGNPGPGGWAAILEYGPHRRELSGGVPATTKIEWNFGRQSKL